MDLPIVNKCVYSPEFLATLNPTQRQAATVYGVERRFLHFATPEYTSDVDEQYAIHQFCTLTATGLYTRLVHSHDVQSANALKLLNSGHLWSEPASIIVINASNYLFSGSQEEKEKEKKKDGDRGMDGFIAHLLCSLAHRVVNRKSPNDLKVSYLETMQLDHSKGYQLSPHHVLIWGPITDYFNSYDYNKTIQFLYSFRNYTRILMTVTKDIGELLGKLHINVDRISYFFNLNPTPEEPTATKKKSKKAGKNLSLD